MTVRVGIGLFTGQVPSRSGRTFEQEYRDTLEIVRLAEALGFDSAWISEHHGASDGYLPSLLVMMGAFADATSRIRLATGVILAPFHDPIRLAEDAAVVDQLSGGRLTLGLGIGWREEEFRMFGVPIAERVPRTVDTIRLLRRAWTGERFSFDGAIYRFDQVKVTPAPAQEGGPPILLGGYADVAIRRAGELADGHITDADDIDHVKRAITLMEEGARGAAKDPASLQLALMVNAFVSEDGTDAWDRAREGVLHQLGAYEAWDAGHDTPSHDSLEAAVADEQAARRGTAAGTPDDVAHALRPIVSALGSRRELDLVVRLHYPGMDLDTAAAAVELFGERVLPALKGE